MNLYCIGVLQGNTVNSSVGKWNLSVQGGINTFIYLFIFVCINLL